MLAQPALISRFGSDIASSGSVRNDDSPSVAGTIAGGETILGGWFGTSRAQTLAGFTAVTERISAATGYA